MRMGLAIWLAAGLSHTCRNPSHSQGHMPANRRPISITAPANSHPLLRPPRRRCPRYTAAACRLCPGWRAAAGAAGGDDAVQQTRCRGRCTRGGGTKAALQAAARSRSCNDRVPLPRLLQSHLGSGFLHLIIVLLCHLGVLARGASGSGRCACGCGMSMQPGGRARETPVQQTCMLQAEGCRAADAGNAALSLPARSKRSFSRPLPMLQTSATPSAEAVLLAQQLLGKHSALCTAQPRTSFGSTAAPHPGC